MSSSTIKYTAFPQTKPPPEFTPELLQIFQIHEAEIATLSLNKGLMSNAVLSVLRKDLINVGFEVEGGDNNHAIIERPVLFGENGQPVLRHQIDAYHLGWKCGIEIEAGRAFMGNAVYRDLIQASLMVDVDFLALALPNAYRYKRLGRETTSDDYRKAVGVADTLYRHSRIRLPNDLILIGY